MQLEEGLDTGPVYATVTTPIGPEETAGELRDRLVALGTPLLLDVLGALPGARARPQEGPAVTAEKLSVAEFRLDPSLGAVTLARIVRAGNPRPGAWTMIGGRRLKVHHAHVIDAAEVAAPVPGRPPGHIDRAARLRTADGLLGLDEVQPEGKALMSGAAWRAGQHDTELMLDEIEHP
jgi:methionyl-tRNA formyltransferase